MATATIDKQATSSSAATESMQLVSFHLADETYGVEITTIREIILMCEITKVPQTPHYIEGLINLRSSVIPVMDLRTFFGLPTGELTDASRIMVINVGERTMGVVVDGVDEVLRIQRDEIAPPPPTVACLGRDYLNGLVRLEEELLILLDIEKILGSESEVLDQVTSSAS